MTVEDRIRFNRICSEVLDKKRGEMGIGSLSEKSIHAVLKRHYAKEFEHQEQKVSGFVADIFDGNEIIEIQTRNFNTLRRKLEAFLPEHKVTIVYPLNHIKYLRWIDEASGEISKARKSPKVGTPYSIFPELYRIKWFLKNENLHFIIASINVEEYRFLDGWSRDKKRGASRSDGIPLELVDEITIDCVQDYLQFLPITLPEQFTTRDFQNHTGVSRAIAGTALNILHYIGIVERVGKQGNSYLYQIPDLYQI